MAVEIDTRGLSCPQPVLLVHEALKKGERNLDVLVDNDASLENVSRAAQKNACSVTQVALEKDVYKLELRG